MPLQSIWIDQFQFVHSFVMNFIFASVFAVYISCVFSIEIDQNIENDSQQPEPPRNTDLYGKAFSYLFYP